MNIFSKTYCRIYQTVFYCFLPFFPYRTPQKLTNYEEILKILDEKGFDNILLITGKKIRGLDLTKELEEMLKNNGISTSVFDGTQVNPTTENVLEAAKVYKENDCQCIIAFGGGSVIDCAKGAGAVIACPNKDIRDMKGLLKVNKTLPLLIAIPTTAGTGSEATLSAVITDSETHHKFVINDFDLIPSYTMLDAKLTLGLSQQTTATTGMDALTHAIEAYIGRSTTPTTRKKALEAIKLIFENLETAYNDGTNLQARKRLLKASYKAGLAFSRSYVGYVHAVAHSLGGKYNIAHGLANATILPQMLKLYGKSVYKKLFKIAKFVGFCDETTKKEVAAKLIIKKIEDMNSNMNIPSRISCIEEKDIEEMAKMAAKEANPLYPVPKLMNAKQLQTIYYMVKE